MMLLSQLLDLATPTAAPNFQGLDFLAGGIWIAEMPSVTGTNSEAIIMNLNNWFMTSTRVGCARSGAVLTNGFLGMDPLTRRLMMWSFSSNGSSVTLTQTPASAKAQQTVSPQSWVFQGVVNGERVRQTMIKEGEHQMSTLAETWVEGKWVMQNPPLTYNRSI
jgi:hypothetical protein